MPDESKEEEVFEELKRLSQEIPEKYEWIQKGDGYSRADLLDLDELLREQRRLCGSTSTWSSAHELSKIAASQAAIVRDGVSSTRTKGPVW